MTLQQTRVEWLGTDLVESMGKLKELMDSMGGYPLPQSRL